MKITTSPFVYRGALVFMPEKMGNLQGVYNKRTANRRAMPPEGGVRECAPLLPPGPDPRGSRPATPGGKRPLPPGVRGFYPRGSGASTPRPTAVGCHSSVGWCFSTKIRLFASFAFFAAKTSLICAGPVILHPVSRGCARRSTRLSKIEARRLEALSHTPSCLIARFFGGGGQCFRLGLWV